MIFPLTVETIKTSTVQEEKGFNLFHEAAVRHSALR
jgi:hypothetical protein